jgi:hypothetical protein
MADHERAAEQLFGEALSLRPERRSAFLDQACHEAPELRSQRTAWTMVITSCVRYESGALTIESFRPYTASKACV